LIHTDPDCVTALTIAQGLHTHKGKDGSMSFLLLTLSILGFNAHAYLWNPANDPSLMDPANHYEYRAMNLPESGAIDTPPWSETYWATYLGSINYRWNSPSPSGYHYSPPSREMALKMNDAELRQLAPSEKYDLLMGRYDYPLFHEAQSYSNPRAKVWSGICDGWSIAAIQYPEPTAVTLMNPDGIAVPFGSSDIKGLMSYAAAIHFNPQARQVGLKCGIWPYSSGCSDINAGSLHVIFKAFVTEIFGGREVWNQPTYAYDYQILGSAYSSSTGKGLLVHANLKYTDELDESKWDPVVGTDAFQSGSLSLDYILDLDESDQIVGGTWLYESDRPDFVWLPSKKLEFKDYFDGMNKILNAAGIEPLP